MSKTTENSRFQCEQCGLLVKPLTNGSYRNHCPHCLYSKHVDEKSGDRKSNCGGAMEPKEMYYHSKKGYQLVHVCTLCGHVQKNKVAKHTVQEDHIVPFMERLMK